MIESVGFDVWGIPTPKGSLTRMPSGGMVPAGTTASRKRMADWRMDIRAAATVAMGERLPRGEAVRLHVDFSLPYPVSSIRKSQLGWFPAIKKPDVDKLLRALLDGLTGIVWRDDAQVIVCNVNKSYAWDGKPGARVTVDFLADDWLKSLASHRTALLAAMERNGINA